MVSLCGCCGDVEMSPTGDFCAVLLWSRVEVGFSGSDLKIGYSFPVMERL